MEVREDSDKSMLGEDKKKKGPLVIKQGQRRDVRAQSHDVPEGGASNVMTFIPNVVK